MVGSKGEEVGVAMSKQFDDAVEQLGSLEVFVSSETHERSGSRKTCYIGLSLLAIWIRISYQARGREEPKRHESRKS